MIEHAHRKYRIEPLEIVGQLFDADRQQVDIVALEVFLQGLELQVEQYRGFDADHAPRRLRQHAPAVIPVAAADVENTAAGERLQRGFDPLPFQIRAPFAIDVDTGDMERPLAPRLQTLQCLVQLTRILTIGVQSHGGQIETRLDLVQRGQSRQRRRPARIVAVTDQPAVALRSQSIRPVFESVAVEIGEQRVQLHGLIASQETKLKALKQQ